MDPTSMDPEEAIYEAAAESSTICKNPKWPLVKVFLEKRGVKKADLNAKSREEWMDLLYTAIKEVKAVKNDADDAEAKRLIKLEKAQLELRPCSMESRPESDDDSGIQLDHYQELSDRPESVNFLVPDHEDYCDGKAALLCSYCDDDDQNYIATTIATRLKVREGADGKVLLTFVVRDGGQSSYRKFLVQDQTINGEEINSDIRFGMKVSEESAQKKRPSEEISNKSFDGGEDERDSELRQLFSHECFMRD